MDSWNWNGARWWKFDFHTHTPASEDYGKGPDPTKQAALKSRTPREWLLDYMRAGIDCVAITDHNSGGRIDELKRALGELERGKPEGFRPLCLFPGVEISVQGGVHLLAILGLEKTMSDIDSLLGAAGYGGTKGKSDDVTQKAFCEVVAAIAAASGLAIPAHVEEANGLFREFDGTTLEQALNCETIVAMEMVDKASPKPQLYVNHKLRWAEVCGSDAHHRDGSGGARYPGSHFTWVKMGTPNLEGLRLALLDGPLSVKRSEEETGDPNRHASLVIESVEVSQARFMGRSGAFRLE
ncbi:ABC transporter, partial [Candidatus Sumerlaeota bacterium]|nr:ABC transporter [Candidatus Sumerlaeota bacterium]